MTQVISIIKLSQQLLDLKEKKGNLHAKLIDTNRLVKLGEAVPEAVFQLKKQISEVTANIRSLEHDLSILTLTVMRTASIKETPYGRVVEYDTEETQE